MTDNVADRSMDSDSSRLSPEGAGWTCRQQAEITDLYRDGYAPKRFHWLSLKSLWRCRNDPIARWIGDSTDGERHRWVEAQKRKGVDPGLTVTEHADLDEVSFLALGDPGEGDASQYHVVRPLLARSRGITFTYIVSDVIYPAGDVADYHDKFFHPYRALPGPIYAIPGNHDWYDGLHGFMALLCDADASMRPPAGSERKPWKRALLAFLWHQAPEIVQDRLEQLRALRPERSHQPAPYFAVELKDLLLVGIDTGIRGAIDAEQAQWLHRISAEPKDKILFTGKPLVVNAHRKIVGITGTQQTVNAIVEDPAHRYIATIGGDTHNYQRYPVAHPDGRVLLHLVTGAGGAYTKATHTIPRATVENCGCDETDFRCYPMRGDSLAAYSILYDHRFGLGRGRFVIPRTEAPQIMAEHLGAGLAPSRETDRGAAISPRARRAARCILPLARWTGPFHRFFSEFLDWDAPNPPLFKSFLRVDIRTGQIDIRCYGATGCAEHERNPPLEDHVRGTRDHDGHWSWDTLPPIGPAPATR